MTRQVEIGGRKVTLNASVWTWVVYKQIYRRTWHEDLANVVSKIAQAAEVGRKYENYTEEDFNKLSKKEVDEYFTYIAETSVDMDFILNALYAMAVAGGFKGSQADMFSDVLPADLEPDSDLIKTFVELTAMLRIDSKKN